MHLGYMHRPIAFRGSVVKRQVVCTNSDEAISLHLLLERLGIPEYARCVMQGF